MMGDKVEARRAMKEAGLPILPGSEEPLKSEDEALIIAREIGFPVIIKASAGGGGRGMRIVRTEEELGPAMRTAPRKRPPPSKRRHLHRALHRKPSPHRDSGARRRARHCIHLGERDCSISAVTRSFWRSADPALTEELGSRWGAAVEACERVGYSSAGTIEFLLDEQGKFYFMEMNTRIQVEHPVTEMVTLTDVVRNQILVAEGNPLWYTQDDVLFVGHSIECRINAEDPFTFAPSPGLITAYNAPGGPGVRLDTAAYPGYFVPPFYDSLIAKLIVHARTREVAIARMRRALEVMVIEGIKTTIPLHLSIMDDAQFRSGEYSTKFMEKFLERRAAPGRAASVKV